MQHAFATSFIYINIIMGCWCLVVEDEKMPIYVSTSVGESALFSCGLDFPHDVQIPYVLNWNKEGERMISVQNGRVTFTRDGYTGRISVNVAERKALLNLTSVREPDHGWYECRLFFPNRTPTTRLNGTWFHLTVHGSDLLGIPPMNQTICEGERVTLDCVSKDETARVVWYKDGLPLGPVGQRAWVSPSGSLTISEAQPSDLGLYRCEVVSSAGQTQSATAFLNVKYKARVIYTPKQVFLPFGRPGVLECQHSANPPTTQVKWEKDGFLFDPFNVPGVLRRNGSLYFNKVEESHGGEYACTPTNEIGSEGASEPIHVVVQHPPVFTLTPHNMYLRKPGDSINMVCDALDGETRPTIVWFKKDGSPLPADRATITGGNLTISDIKESDRGLYQCVASNEAATISADTELLIENSTPRGPHNLTGEAGLNYVTLSWHPGILASSSQYSVAVRAIDSQDWRTIRVTGNKATISSLDPGREYEFMILSQDPNGDGMFSKPLRLITKGSSSDAQVSTPIGIHGPLSGSQEIGPPRRLRIYSGVDGYILEWDGPSFGAEFLDKYQVFRAQETPEYLGEEGLPLVQDTMDTSYLVGDLAEDSIHHFQVKSLSTDGTEASSDRFVLHVPSYQKAQTFSLFIAALIGFLVAMIIMCIYANRIYVRSQIEMLKGPRR